MPAWSFELIEFLWQNGLFVVPVVLTAAVASRLFPCRPSTRYFLWLFALLWCIIPLNQVLVAVSEIAPTTDVLDGQFAERPVTIDQPSSLIHEVEPQNIELETSDVPSITPVGEDPSDHTAWHVIDPTQRIVEIAEHASQQGVLLVDLIAQQDEAPTEIEASSSESKLHGNGRLEPLASIDGPVEPTMPASKTVDLSAVGANREWAQQIVQVRDAIVALPAIPPSWWMGGICILLLLALIRAVRLYRLLGQSYPAPHSVVSEVQSVASDLRIRVPDVHMINLRMSPMIVCYRRARLVIPAELWQELDRIGRHAVICHELAHLKRRDHWVFWLEYVIGILYWWHPVVWWIRHKLRDEAEHCCDAWVTWLLPKNRRDYAQALLRAKQFVSQPAPLAVSMYSSNRANRFARRIRMVMTETANPRLSVSVVAWALALVLVGWIVSPVLACPPKCDKKEAKKAPAVEKEHGHHAPTTFEQYMARTGSLLQVSHDDNDDPTSERLERVERRLERLVELMEHMRDGHVPRSPRQPREPRAPRMRERSRSFDNQSISRKYHLPECKLKALTELMVREDVPILVTPGKDHIEVHATEAQHRVFATFVGHINPKEQSKKYTMSSGKLKALTKLMVRNDVPVLVSPSKEHITVHGGEAVQLAFEDFVALIEGHYQTPMRDDRSPGYDRSGFLGKMPAPDVSRLRQLMEASESFEVRAEELEDRAEELEAKSELLEERAQSIEEASELLEGQAREMALRQAQALMKEVKALLAQASAMEIEAEAMEERSEVISEALEFVEAQRAVIQRANQTLEQALINADEANELVSSPVNQAVDYEDPEEEEESASDQAR